MYSILHTKKKMKQIKQVGIYAIIFCKIFKTENMEK